ncbi:MAG TPA: M20 family metallopeptidase [Actinomycetota bacterium]|jgi:acetylornithine deacetylase/succinyl-diaminopimelate desuccinylase family protein
MVEEGAHSPGLGERAVNVESGVASAVAAAVDPDEVLRFARALVTTPSENPGGTEDAVAEVVVGILEGIGADARIVRGEAGRPSVVARIGDGSRPRLAWNGHLDVVPAGDPGTWSHPPFAAEVVDGRLVGRGAADMKGPVASALAAVAAIRRSGVRLGGTIDLHLVADEELTGLNGTKVLLEQSFLDQDAAIVGEPTDLRLMLAERGGAWVRAIARGRAAHGSTPQLGVNAITSMARFLLRIEEVLPDLEHPLVGRPSVNAAIIEGGSAPNVVPDTCVVDVDRRVVPGETDPAAVLEPFERLARAITRDHPEVDLSFDLHLWTDAAEADPDSEISRVCRAAMRAETGRTTEDSGLTGITDARFYLNDAGVQAVLLGPGSLTVAHTADEWVAVEDLVTASRIYARVFAAFCA